MLPALKDASVEQPADVLVGTLHRLVRLALAEIDFVEYFFGLALALRGDLLLQVVLVTFLKRCEVDLKISALLVHLYLLLRILRLPDGLPLVPLTVVLTRPVGLFLLPIRTHRLVDFLYLL